MRTGKLAVPDEDARLSLEPPEGECKALLPASPNRPTAGTFSLLLPLECGNETWGRIDALRGRKNIL